MTDMRLACCFVVATALLAGTSPRAQGEINDRIRLAKGSETGEVTKMTRYEVTLDKGAAGNAPISVNAWRPAS